MNQVNGILLVARKKFSMGCDNSDIQLSTLRHRLIFMSSARRVLSSSSPMISRGLRSYSARNLVILYWSQSNEPKFCTMLLFYTPSRSSSLCIWQSEILFTLAIPLSFYLAFVGLFSSSGWVFYIALLTLCVFLYSSYFRILCIILVIGLCVACKFHFQLSNTLL